MLIAVLDLRTSASDRVVALAQLDSEHDEIRAMPGNLDFRVYDARDNQEAVTVIHEWADEPSFAAYLSSEAFARFRRGAPPDGHPAPGESQVPRGSARDGLSRRPV